MLPVFSFAGDVNLNRQTPLAEAPPGIDPLTHPNRVHRLLNFNL
jgi:hypothetical protein